MRPSPSCSHLCSCTRWRRSLRFGAAWRFQTWPAKRGEVGWGARKGVESVDGPLTPGRAGLRLPWQRSPPASPAAVACASTFHQRVLWERVLVANGGLDPSTGHTNRTSQSAWQSHRLKRHDTLLCCTRNKEDGIAPACTFWVGLPSRSCLKI